MGVSLLLKVSPDAGVWGEEASTGWDLHTALAVRLWVSPPPTAMWASASPFTKRPSCDGGAL